MPILRVSVVIPAHNAAQTIAETIKSLLCQTYPHWEAIVVDDGSTDETAAIAHQFTSKDSRIRTVSQSNQGVCAARNTGIDLANFDWLLFLDADDWLAPQHLEKMTAALAADSSLDAVHCGWSRVAADGTLYNQKYAPALADMFPLFVRSCAFVIHACLIRKSLIEAVGRFDTSLCICEDWDLWQRIARSGARFGAVREILALYRMRPSSLSRNGNQFFTDAIRVLTQGYSSDPRVPNPHHDYVDGLKSNQLASQKLYWASWCAGLFLGVGQDARHLLQLIKDEYARNLDPLWIAECIFESSLLPNCQLPTVWYKLWPNVNQYLNDFLQALESQSHTTGLTRRTSTLLERMVLQHAQINEPITIGTTHGVCLDLTQPIVDIHTPASSERLYCIVKMEGIELGSIELPICDGLVASWVIQDAIASQFAWQILGRFFEQTIYSQTDKNSHDQIGWTVFLQQLWGLPDWPSERFYDSEFAAATTTKKVNSAFVVVEVSEELADLEVALPELDVMITVGGVALGVVTIPVKNNLVTSQAQRVAIATASGFELCITCVREALIGKPFKDLTSLRSRLQQAAKAKAQLPEWLAFPGSSAVIEHQLVTSQTIVLGRRCGFNGSVSRRAILPKAVARELVEMAKVTAESIVQLSSPGEMPERVIYAPEALGLWSKCSTISSATDLAEVNTSHEYDRSHFESLFSTQPDPWKYTNPYEQTKYEQTLSLLPSQRIEKALELACAEGHFTVQLAPHIESLIAADISQVALERTAQRCSNFQNISYQQLDMNKDPLPGRFNLIVCSEVLYYTGGLAQLQAVAEKIADALEPGGYLIMAHAHQIVDEPDKPGFDWGLPFGAKAIGDTFARLPSLNLVKEIRTPLYRVQLFQRQPRLQFPWLRHTPEIVELAKQPTPIPSQVEASVRWHGGQPSEIWNSQPVVTHRLPILMYHRVAPMGTKKMDRYRVTPQAFEEQLQYLRDTGFYSVGWQKWQLAMATRQPLPGRAIAITFDDGYLDFYEYAWPLLKKYNFTVTVFLVAERVGTSNSWDEAYEEEVPLLGWREIHQLQSEGVEFGSHAATHQPLTALSLTEIVQEGARSRAILERALNLPVKTFAYPYGDCDRVVEHLIGACGYTLGLSCRSGLSQFGDRPLSLPRIEVMGSDSLQEFIRKIPR
ncbi:glycosyl transferase family 2 [Nostoc sp. T09]|uniref:trifunctional glycosyltransferase/class I SAM-dependent methyltransferase/polysaccharide deacetylase n=1 Tax=Nostoc sp. T09 TaxID=1932621 RepID=UPI000A3AE426|nr:trifunctional glycosyltransferase/class I SAM-dependent methyltransferase/polysaccharide deacetylase [Nostoc sp. T09]OUL28411.1 glycosyl transferase family 2 [Nostoc sp. T09]